MCVATCFTFGQIVVLDTVGTGLPSKSGCHPGQCNFNLVPCAIFTCIIIFLFYFVESQKQLFGGCMWQ